MKSPVPLTDEEGVTESDGVKEIFHKSPDQFKELGYTQYFYLQQDAEIPIRDVKDTHGKNNKTEPCIEYKAENLCSKCYQSNISSFTKNLNRRYLFLVTNTRDTVLEEKYGRQKWIVGYIEKQRGISVNGRIAVQGPIKLVSFEDAVSVKEIDADTGFRSNKKLDGEQTRTILNEFSDAKNIYEKCLEAVKKYEAEIGRIDPWESARESSTSHRREIRTSSEGGC